MGVNCGLINLCCVLLFIVKITSQHVNASNIGDSSFKLLPRAKTYNDSLLNVSQVANFSPIDNTSDSTLSNFTEIDVYYKNSSSIKNTTYDEIKMSTNLKTSTANLKTSTTSKRLIVSTTSSPRSPSTTPHEKPKPSVHSITLVTTTKLMDNYTTTENESSEAIGSILDNWMDVFSKSYWQKRLNDRFYTLAMLLPIAIGIGIGGLFVLCICLFRGICRRKYHKMKFEKQYASKEDHWMLLDRRHSSDDDESV